MTWAPSFANLAQNVGVSPDEALRKTDFTVYQAVSDAAFDTPELASLRINGAWRPSPADYQSVNGKKLPDGFRKWWSPAHVTSTALDINLVNGFDVNGGSYNAGHASRPEPPVISDFIDNLASRPNSSQLFSPWQMNSHITDPFEFSTNQGRKDNANELIHENHIHFGITHN
jgi:hypothetical protein